MTPLQKIAMGLVIVVANAYFPAHPHPAWKVYDGLPDPLGWILVIAGIAALHRLRPLETVRWLAVVAAVVSVPMWVPQLNHQLDTSGEWFASMPQTLCCLFLAREIGMAGAREQPRDAYVAKRFGLLTWAFAIMVLLPVVALGGGVEELENPTVIFSAIINIAFIFYLFMVHRRTYLGGPGPRLIKPDDLPTRN